MTFPVFSGFFIRECQSSPEPMRSCQWMFMGSQGKVLGSSSATELHISYPLAPGGNLGNIVADKNQVVKSNDAN